VTKKIDLFVYSSFSRSSFSPSSFLTPEQIYKQAKKAGMDFVTLTDVNTLDGCLNFLDHHPQSRDFIVGEEVWCQVPEFKTTASIGVYGITETQHREILKRKGNMDDLAPYLKEEGITHILGHFLYRFAKSARHPAYISKLLELFDIFEVHHGQVIGDHNLMSAYFIKSLPHKGIGGGSHAKSLSAIGKTYTVCQASHQRELLNNISIGLASTEGTHATLPGLLKEIFENKFEEMIHLHEKKQYLSLAALLMTLPGRSLKQFMLKTLELRNEKRHTPFYSLLLGESQRFACDVPKELIEV